MYGTVRSAGQSNRRQDLEKWDVTASRRTETVTGASAPLHGAGVTVARQSLLYLIGNTPLLPLPHIGSKFPNIEFYAKAEWFNPGGSVKDRPALSMIEAGLRERTAAAGKDDHRCHKWKHGHCLRHDRGRAW